VIHRVIYGSLERFLGVLIEHFAGHLPLWLAPVQCELIPVQDDVPDVLQYIDRVVQRMRDAGLRPAVNHKPGERMQGKVRDAELRRVPYVVVVGRRDIERADDVVRVRDVRRGEQRDVGVNELISVLCDEVRQRRPS
jgi:threonyl-tRNA synthetase